jgi:hypothetical protein
MPDTPTPKRGLLRPVLGKKPWKEDWDFNFLKLDGDVGGLIDGTIAAGNSSRFGSKLPAEYVQTVSGTLAGLVFLDNQIRVVEVDHSASVVFDIPGPAAFVLPTSGIRVVHHGEVASLSDADYGGTFYVGVENSTGSTISGQSITWRRTGFVV